MTTFFNLFTFIYLTVWVVPSITRIVKGDKSTLNFVMCVFYFFFAIPLLLDEIIGKPEYLNRPGFRLAANDQLTTIVYCLYMMLVPIVWKIQNRKSSITSKKDIRLNQDFKMFFIIRKVMPLLLILIILPIILLLISPEPNLYLNYGATALHILTGSSRDFHTFIELSTLLSVLSASLILMVVKSKNIFTILIVLFPFLFLSIWLNGKRYIVLFTIVLILYVLWNRRILIGKKLMIIGLLIVCSFAVFSTVYQDSLRFDGGLQTNSIETYENFRLDYGRDDVTKLAIYAELNPETTQILDYRGQSMLFYLLMYVPRDMWEEKPMPYAKYVTSAMFLVEPQLWSWGMTTSILEEAISNFSWLGLIIGPLIVGTICRVGDRFEDPLINILTLFIACLFLVVHLPAFAPIFYIWLVLVIFSKLKKKIRI